MDLARQRIGHAIGFVADFGIHMLEAGAKGYGKRTRQCESEFRGEIGAGAIETQPGIGRDRSASRGIPLLVIILELHAETDLVRAHLIIFVPGDDSREALHQVVAIADRAKGKRILADMRAGVNFTGNALARVEQETRHGNIDHFPDHFEIDPHEVGAASFQETLADGAKVEFFPEIRRQIFKSGDVAVGANQGFDAAAQIRRQFSLVGAHAGDGYVFDGVSLVHVAFRSGPKQFLIGVRISRGGKD